jgi:predicted nuclease of predicted toxin-antitoxin system
MKLLLDQGLPRSTRDLLRQLGHEVAHVGDLGMARAKDEEILAIAKESNAIIVTLDADFHALLVHDSATGPSVIRLRVQGLGASKLCAVINNVLVSCGDELAKGAAVSASENYARVHRLPF